MSYNYWSSFTTSDLFKTADFNPRLSDLDNALSNIKEQLIHCDGTISWDSSGNLSWDAPLRIEKINPGDGCIISNQIASATLTLTTGLIVYADLSTVHGATITATYSTYSTASTVLVPDSRVILGITNSEQLEFFPNKWAPALSNILNEQSTLIVQHDINSTVAHTGTATQGNLLMASSNGLPVDSSYAASDFAGAQHDINSTVAHSGTATEGNLLMASSNGLPVDSNYAPSCFVGAHDINSTAAHTGTATEGNLLQASSNGLPVDSSRSVSQFLGGRETSVTCGATFTVDFTSAETRFVELTTNSSCIITGGSNGQVYRLRVTQDATGNWTLSIGATAGSISWAGGAAPTISTAASKSDWLTFVRSNGTWFADARQNF